MFIINREVVLSEVLKEIIEKAMNEDAVNIEIKKDMFDNKIYIRDVKQGDEYWVTVKEIA